MEEQEEVTMSRRRLLLSLLTTAVCAATLAVDITEENDHMPHHPVHPKPPVQVTRAAPPVAPTVAAAYTFADEFAGAAGSPPNPANWKYVTGPGASVGGNNETETYVDSTDNAYLDGEGHLVIAVTSSGGGFNSARLTSVHSQLHGSWEASIAITNTQGCWPAFWFMGKNGAWPGCGEADVMENYGTGFTDGTLWNSSATGNANAISASRSDDNFHLYRIVSQQGSISYYRDNVLYLSATSKSLTPWPFDANGGLYAILNIATNGTGTDGVSPPASAMPVQMLVDYVHCWQ
jgi:beta-glucanase (GH16 family)